MAHIGPFRGPIPKDVARDVAGVVPRVQLADLRLVSLAASLLGTQGSGATDVDLQHRATAQFVENAAVIRVEYSLAAKHSGERADAVFLTVDVTFQLSYVGDDLQSVEKGQWTTFADVNAVHNSWPYFREVVQNVTARMGVEPLIVPLLKLTRPASASAKARAANPPK